MQSNFISSKIILKYLKTIFYVTIFTFLTSCEKGKSSISPTSRPLILVSVAPYQFFVKKIGQELVDVQSVVKEGADIHTYEPTPHQRDAIRGAQIWFRIGEPFEQKLLDVFQNDLSIIDLRNGIDLIDQNAHESCSHELDSQDRHMWLSPKIAQIQAKTIAKTLSERFPNHRKTFETNLQTLLSNLESLDQEIAVALKHLENHILLVSHPAFGYFCRDYNLTQLSVEFEGKEPCTKYLNRLLNRAKRTRPDVAIFLPQHNNKGTRVIAEELKLPIKMIDPYSHDYFETMRTLTHWIADQK